MRKIGVFDSGIGGKSVALALEKAFPELEVEFISDLDNLPYGTKTPDELKAIVAPKIQELENTGVELIVIACNTVSTTILEFVKKLVKVPVIGVEPMVEEASKITKSGTITVCATPTTLSSGRYLEIKNKYANGLNVIEPDYSRWTKMIEDNQIDRDDIFEKIDGACREGSDAIVLGCTHYHWIKDLIGKISNGRAAVIYPEQQVINKIKELISNT